MIIRTIILAILGSVSLMHAAAQPVSREYEDKLLKLYDFSVDTISPARVNATNDKVYLIDTREMEEYRVSHIKGAIPLGYRNPNFSLLFGVPKNAKVVIYCSVGYRSEKIGEVLKARGFTNVFNLYGGIFHWMNSGYPVYSGGKLTTDVHPYSQDWGKWLKKGNKVYE